MGFYCTWISHLNCLWIVCEYCTGNVLSLKNWLIALLCFSEVNEIMNVYSYKKYASSSST